MSMSRKVDWKLLAVLLPGGLLGAGAGALVTAFQYEWALHAAPILQVAGIGLMVGSIILRIALSQNGLRLTDHAGLLANWACVFLSGLGTIAALMLNLQGHAADPILLGAILALAWIPCLLVTALGVAAFARMRSSQPVARKD